MTAAETSALGELARHGRLEVRTSEYRESTKGPAAAVTLFCADGSLLQVFSRGVLERDPERIREHQESVRGRLGALQAELRRWRRRLDRIPWAAGIVAGVGALLQIVAAIRAGDWSALAAIGCPIVWCVGCGLLGCALRRAFQWWARKRLREALQRWLGQDAPAVTGSRRS